MREITKRHNLRPMTVTDLSDAHRLSQAVGWPHRLDDWRFVLDIGQGIAAGIDGRIVGTAMWWTFDARVARLGMVVVDPTYQKRGLGRALMHAALAAIAVPTVILNATVAGEPLYRQLGFAPAGEIMQYQGVVPAAPATDLPKGTLIRPAGPGDAAAVVNLDRQAGGVRRGNVIDQLLAKAQTVVAEQAGLIVGFASCRRFGRGYAVGPIVAGNPELAKSLLLHWMSAKAGEFLRIDVPMATGLSTWLERLGFAAIAPAITMARGPLPLPQDGNGFHTYGLINQALG